MVRIFITVCTASDFKHGNLLLNCTSIYRCTGKHDVNEANNAVPLVQNAFQHMGNALTAQFRYFQTTQQVGNYMITVLFEVVAQ